MQSHLRTVNLLFDEHFNFQDEWLSSSKRSIQSEGENDMGYTFGHR